MFILMPTLAFAKTGFPVGEVKKNENQNNGKKVEIGSVEQTQGTTITYDEKNNGKKEIKVEATTKIIGQEKKTLKVSQLKMKDMIAVISTDSSDSTGSGKIKKILKIYIKEASISAQSKRRAVSGVIDSINGNVLTLAHQIQRDRKYSVTVGVDTSIIIKNISQPTFADLKIGMRISTVGDLSQTGGIIAKRIHAIPGKAVGIFEKRPFSATPSGTATISASSTPVSTISATPTATITSAATLTPTLTPATTP